MKKINYKNIFFFTLIIIIISFSLYQHLGAKGEKEDLFQKAVNEEFKKIDKEIEDRLKQKKENKTECFGPNKQKTLAKCSDELEKDFDLTGKYAEKYAEGCKKALEKSVKQQKNEEIGNKDSLTILDPYIGACTMLYLQKLGLYKGVAYNILKRNKVQVLEDELKKMQQQEQEKMGKVSEHLKENNEYLQRISNQFAGQEGFTAVSNGLTVKN